MQFITYGGEKRSYIAKPIYFNKQEDAFYDISQWIFLSPKREYNKHILHPKPKK